MKPNVKPTDVHVVINDWEGVRYVGEAKCYNPKGDVLWTIPALCKGVEGARWDVRNGDTPPGLYRAGVIIQTQPHESAYIWNAYGRWCIDMEEQQGQEAKVGRAGICWHGGGTGCPDPLAPRQQLLPTLGCVRSHNADIHSIVIPTLNKVTANGGTMWITVNQIG
ncbi:MAG: hypothetical protein NW224_00225 [Leptolyngbyaceae cyanobacterium bins.302]|nr:hypothetical protein [Leptolyngbyaceae cyanobacterium bins.302]